ncbi:MAG TPA: hypothetical protein VLX09_20510 [Stellaceae bacterium]|nr:hypothetical protein [Stellaceae bacterium]
MSLHGALVAEYLRWGALSFVAPIGWERSKWRRRSGTKHVWLWVLIFVALALGQLTIAVLHPVAVAEVFATT